VLERPDVFTPDEEEVLYSLLISEWDIFNSPHKLGEDNMAYQCILARTLQPEHSLYGLQTAVHAPETIPGLQWLRNLGFVESAKHFICQKLIERRANVESHMAEGGADALARRLDQAVLGRRVVLMHL